MRISSTGARRLVPTLLCRACSAGPRRGPGNQVHARTPANRNPAHDLPTPGTFRPRTHRTGPPRRGHAASCHVRAHATCRARGNTHTWNTLTHTRTPLSRHALEPCLGPAGKALAVAPSDLGTALTRPPSLRCWISMRVAPPPPLFRLVPVALSTHGLSFLAAASPTSPCPRRGLRPRPASMPLQLDLAAVLAARPHS